MRLFLSFGLLLTLAAAAHPMSAGWRLLRTVRTPDWGAAPLALSPDGRLLASCTATDVTVRDLATGRVRVRLPAPHASASGTLVFSPDGRTLALATGAAAFSPDGREFALGGGAVASLWDVTTGQPSAHLGPADEKFAVWDATHRLLWTARAAVPGYESQALSLAFSPDGRTLASGSVGGGLQTWSAADGTLLRTLTGPPATWRGASAPARRGGVLGHPGRVIAVAFSPDGRSLVSAGGDGSVRLWDPATVALRRIILSPAGVQAIALRGDGSTLVAGFRRDIAVLDLVSGRTLRTLRGHDEDVRALAPEGKTLWSGAGDGTIKRWDLTRGACLATYGRIQQAVVSADGSTLAYSLGDSDVTVQGLAGGRARRTLRRFSRPERAGSFSHSEKTLALSGDGRWLAGGAYTTEGFVDHSGVFHSRVMLWDIGTGRRVHLWAEEPAAQLAFRPDARRLVETTADLTDTPSSLRVRAVPEGALVREWLSDANVRGPYLGQPRIALSGAAPVFEPDGRLWLATTGPGHGGRVVAGLWDVMTGRLVRILTGSAAFPHGAAAYDANRDGRLVAGVGEPGAALWDGRTGRRRWLSRSGRGLTETGVTVSPDGRWVVTGEGPDGFDAGGAATPVLIRDGATGRFVARLDGPAGGLIWVSFSPDSRRLFAASRDGAVRVWALSRSPPRAVSPHAPGNEERLRREPGRPR